ncbi:MAG: amidase [Dehalococcoidia bacterium]|nr:amidase [Dehalococcoidia bacterium]
MNDIAFLDATTQAELVRKKQIKPSELVDAAIERIERLNPALNAVVTPMYDEARKIASGPLPDGPFAGVPFLLKDLTVEYAGVRMTAGSAFLQDYVSPEDSELTRRFKRAGLIVLGKANTPEFGLVPTTESKLLGAAHNPWNTGRTTGGSSGGSAASVAAGIVPMAHANDGGGSIRIPASCCGLFGLKTTRARNPGPGYNFLSQDHALTRTVRDSAALLDAICGPDLGDPYWAPPPARPFVRELGVDPGRLRIAFAAQTFTGVPLHADCLAAVKDAAALCQDLGHEVVEASPPVVGDSLVQSFTSIWAGGCATTIDGWAAITGRKPARELFEPLTWALYEMGQKTSASEFLLALADFDRMTREIARFFLDYDIWLTPTLGEPPVALGTFDAPPEDPMRAFERAAQFVPFTPIANATGQPAMSVPLYWNGEGLPVGAHFVARFGEEATLLRLASQLEEARPWAHKRPPVTA